jgi:phosphoribosyl 1,2-cyclic phosphodiesterase
MNVRFWGTRGSLPASVTARQIREKISRAVRASRAWNLANDGWIETFIDRELPFAVRGGYGGNTACVEIEGGEGLLLCDAGTGIRDFGNAFMRAGRGSAPAVFHLFVSHPHWDHIQGFPFFTPAYLPNQTIHIYGGHAELEAVFERQQEPPCFPVPFRSLRAKIAFHVLDPEQRYDIAGFSVRLFRQNHPGGSYGYSFTRNGKKIVYSTDMEHGPEAEGKDYPYLDLFRDADILIFDAQYPLADAIGMKETWGHSSNLLGVELAVRSGVRHLCLFHSEPTSEDETLDHFLTETREYLKIHAPGSALKVDQAYDGMVVAL